MKKLRVKKIKCLFHGPSALTKQKPALSNWPLSTRNEYRWPRLLTAAKPAGRTTLQLTFSGLTDRAVAAPEADRALGDVYRPADSFQGQMNQTRNREGDIFHFSSS